MVGEWCMAELRVNAVGTTGAGRRLLVLIHGYGADENDLAPLARAIDPAGDYYTICPRGPIDLEGSPGAAWYDRSAEGEVDEASYQASVLALSHLIEGANQQLGLNPAETVIIGFSQGAAMTYSVGLRETTRPRPAGIACLSGRFQEPDWMVHGWSAPDLPKVLIQHGTQDAVVSVDQGRASRDSLASHGITATYGEYPMAHEIRNESIADLQAWMRTV